MTRAGWERNFTKYLTVGIVVGVVATLLFMVRLIRTNAEMDLIIDGPLQLISILFGQLIIALIVYYLEEQFGSVQ